MTPKEISELSRRADEIAWRHVWLTNVLVDAGKPSLAKIARPGPTRRMSLARRLDKLHRLRTAWSRHDHGSIQGNFRLRRESKAID
jgi:hypothetical protein